MRIAFFTDTFYPQVNGVATSVASFAKELGSRGHEVLIIMPSPSKKTVYQEWQSPGVRILHLPSVPLLLYPDFRMSPLIGFPKSIKALRAFNPDVIHFHTTLTVALDALLASWLLRKPLIGTNHLLLTTKNSECLGFISSVASVRNVLTKIATRYSLAFYRNCNARIAPSEMLIEALQSTGYHRALVCLPNPVPPSCLESHPSKASIAALKKQYGLGERVVLHMGRLSREKAIERVLHAFAKVHLRDAEAMLFIIGDGPDRERLEGIVAQLGLQKHVVFAGYIEHEQVMQSGMLQVGNVFVTCSPMESQGMVLVESMAFGLPVIAVRAGAIPEVVADAGILHDLEDIEGIAASIYDVLHDAALAKRLASTSLQRAEAFSPKVLTDQMLALYEKSIKECLIGIARSPRTRLASAASRLRRSAGRMHVPRFRGRTARARGPVPVALPPIPRSAAHSRKVSTGAEHAE
jgi:1,2-diacylglycerol 3-alpha-glucosyltransferase